MSSYGESQHTATGPGNRRPPPPSPPRKAVKPPACPPKPRPVIPSRYLINDIPRNTRSDKLFNYLISPPHCHDEDDDAATAKAQPPVQFSCIITDSRLDDELSVAVFEFTDTPQWLRCVNRDPFGFPKKTPLGTLWRGVDTAEQDANGQTEFIRAAIKDDLLYAEALAEFSDTDVNVQDTLGRTGLHWACAKSLPDIVRLCLSVPSCNVGLRDKDNLTAFDIARQGKNELIPLLFYKDMIDLDEHDPQTALLRTLTLTTEPMTDRPIFPGVALFDPIQDRNSALVEALITRGVDLTARNADGDTALHLAARQVNNVEIATRLLEAGSDIEAIGGGGATALHHAARSADEEMVQVLLHWKADVLAVDFNEETPLQWAEQNGQRDTARILVDHAAHAEEEGPLQGGLHVIAADEAAEVVVDKIVRNVVQSSVSGTGEVNYTGKYRLDEAAEAGNLEAVLLLLEQGADIETITSRGTALCCAAKCGYTDIVVALLGKGANIEAGDTLGRTALHKAAQHGHTESVIALLAKGANIEAEDSSGRTALQEAAHYGHTESVTALLAKGANIEAGDSSGRTALYQAARSGHTMSVTALLAKGANTEAGDSSGRTALYQAARSGHTMSVTALLAKGANTEAGDWSGRTALHQAARSGHSESVTALLAKGANTEARDSLGRTALQEAAYCGRTMSVTALLAKGANIEAEDSSGRTALHQAAWHGHTESVTALLAKGANTEAGNRTALSLAAQYGHTKSVTALLAKGANTEAADDQGMTALHWAATNGERETAEILLTNKGEIEAQSNSGTALQVALRGRYGDTACMLVARGAQITKTSRMQLALLPLTRRRN